MPRHARSAVFAQSAIVAAMLTLAVQDGTVADDRTVPEAASGDWFRPDADPVRLRQLLEEDFISDRWIYHDLDAAQRQARDSGKPILAVFRCVPCGSAPGLDGALCTAGGAEASAFEAEIRAAGGELDALLDQVVAVRMVMMNGVNRNLFQFDRDVPYVAVFLNADGIVYGRYGTRTSRERRDLPRHNLSSFQQSLRRALDLHEEYPRNAAQLAAKQGAGAGPAMPEEMPTFVPFPAEHNPKVSNCIHCHTVGEAEVRQRMADGDLALRDVWPYPLPENVGLSVEPDDGLLVKSVTDGSPAEEAGVRTGDVLLALAGQPLVSEADVQWALHHAPDEAALPLLLRRGERTVETELRLQGDWRKSDGHWRASIAPLRPDLHLRPDPYRVNKGAAPGRMGLTVYYPRGPASAAGLRNGDLLVGVDGRTDLHLEADFLKYIHFDRRDARTVELTIIRDGARSNATLPIRE